MSSIIQRSFAGGEIAPALYARADTTKYATGLRTLRNFLLMRHGGAQNRPGSEFVCEVKDSSKEVRLIPFIFNSTQTYMLEFGDQYMRVIRSGVQSTLTSQAITGITNANPAVLTYGGADTYANGDEVYISDIVGPIGTYLNNRNFKVASVDTGANTFALNYMNGTAVNSTAMGAYTSGGTVEEVYTISTPYVEADLAELQFIQSADVITIVHPSYAPRELSRSGHVSWTLSTITFAPTIAAPTSPNNNGGGSGVTIWAITSVASETLEESLQSSDTSSNATPTSGAPITITWTVASGAQEYNVYKKTNGVYGFIGVAIGTSFIDDGIIADANDTPPTARNPFNATDDYPSTVTYFQQRLTFANTNNNPETVWGSRSGQYKNFTVSSPIQDDDAVTFSLAGRQVNEVRHLVDLGQLLSLTSGGEWTIAGDGAGILKPGDINPKQYSYNGANSLAPIIIGGNALYVQARGSVVRDLAFDYQVDGYRGNDLTIFSAHLFDSNTLVDWCYQQIPHSIVWAVRDDGVLLGLTYVREHQLWGWHRHDTDGTYENVSVVPEGNEDFLYVVVKRTINGATKRYIERVTTRQVDEDAVEDSIFVDASLSYDGRNTNSSHTMTLSEYSSGGWLYTSTITCTSSSSYFEAADVGNAVHITGADGTIVRFTITEYVSATVVRGTPQATVIAAMRSAALSDWALAVDELTGLWHLEDKDVSIFADGFVVANPNNEAYDTVNVTNGTISLDKPYTVIHVGLPYLSDLETLDIESTSGETLTDKNKIVQRVSMHVEASRGIWVGPKPPSDDDTDPLENLMEVKIRNDETYDDPVALATEVVEVLISPEWNSNGRVFVRQTDPLPLSVLSIVPAGMAPFRGN